MIHATVEKALELIGGLNKVVPPGSKVFVKINHISPATFPEGGLIIHPIFLKTVLNLKKTALISRWEMTSNPALERSFSGEALSV